MTSHGKACLNPIKVICEAVYVTPLSTERLHATEPHSPDRLPLLAPPATGALRLNIFRASSILSLEKEPFSLRIIVQHLLLPQGDMYEPDLPRN